MNESTVTEHLTNHPAAKSLHGTLTPREIEVLTVLHEGMTIPEIAAALGVCPSTVRNHTQHILLKLHVHSRHEAVALGCKLGLI